jgi:hypothetical protein
MPPVDSCAAGTKVRLNYDKSVRKNRYRKSEEQ